jgi:hypothetical protein
MLRKFLCVGVIALFCTSAKAGIVFDDAVDLNLSVLGLTDITGIKALDFGSTSTGRVAVNTTDNGDAIFGLGDTMRVVGHTQVKNGDKLDGSGEFDLAAAAGGTFELTGVLRNVDTTVSFAAGPVALTTATAGFLDLYVDLAPTSAFTIGDVGPSASPGTAVATFELISGSQTIILGAPSTSSDFQFRLVSQLGDGTADLDDDFFQLPSGADPLAVTSLLATAIVSTDTRTASTLTGISGVDIGAGFAPSAGIDLTNGDFYASVDGNAAFAVLPEPSSVLAFVGIGFAGVVSRRRRKKNA